MDKWYWMVPPSPAGVARAAQTAQYPLSKDSGGTCAAFSIEDFKKKKDWKTGQKYIFLGCLGWVDTRYGLDGLDVSEKQIEKLGRTMFTTARWTEDFDDFWANNEPKFPASWPEHAALPIVIYEETAVPPRGQWLTQMYEELVMSFWKIYNYVQEEIAALQAKVLKLASGGESCQQELASVKKRLAIFEEQATAADRLSRNVVFSMRWAENEEQAKEQSIQSREDLDTLSDFCGLFGWCKIKLIGLRFDELTAKKGGANCPATPGEVARSFAKIRFGDGREVTESSCRKIITMWKN